MVDAICNGKHTLLPKCVIGKYGYALSILEQIGCLYRFYEHYCKPQEPQKLSFFSRLLSTPKPLDEKCIKKQSKYMERYADAYEKMKNMKPTTEGGNRKYRPRILKTRRSTSKRTRRSTSKRTRRSTSKRTRRHKPNIHRTKKR